jgi:uncharacterized protein (UPF0332 family)
MSLADDLLEAARYLLRQNRSRPGDGAVRRAISTAYYALFHRLLESATAVLVSTPDQQHALARAFEHGRMRRVCEALNQRVVPPPLAAILGTAPPDELKQFTQTFVELQDRRHDADYNLGRTFSKTEAGDLVKQVEAALARWTSIPEGTAKPFLLLLLVGEPKGR